MALRDISYKLENYSRSYSVRTIDNMIDCVLLFCIPTIFFILSLVLFFTNIYTVGQKIDTYSEKVEHHGSSHYLHIRYTTQPNSMEYKLSGEDNSIIIHNDGKIKGTDKIALKIYHSGYVPICHIWPIVLLALCSIVFVAVWIATWAYNEKLPAFIMCIYLLYLYIRYLKDNYELDPKIKQFLGIQ